MTEASMNIDSNIENTLIGRVNWFNRRKGYGFISVVTPGNELTNTDVFFHYTQIMTENFKVLYPGEYVSFSIGSKDDNGEQKSVCENITGLFGNPLLIDNSKYNFKVTEKRQRNNKTETQESPEEEM